MSSSDKPQPGRRPSGKPGPADATGGDKVSSGNQDMGAALRSVYQRAVDEEVPDDLMALLGKLG